MQGIILELGERDRRLITGKKKIKYKLVLQAYMLLYTWYFACMQLKMCTYSNSSTYTWTHNQALCKCNVGKCYVSICQQHHCENAKFRSCLSPLLYLCKCRPYRAARWTMYISRWRWKWLSFTGCFSVCSVPASDHCLTGLLGFCLQQQNYRGVSCGIWGGGIHSWQLWAKKARQSTLQCQHTQLLKHESYTLLPKCCYPFLPHSNTHYRLDRKKPAML